MKKTAVALLAVFFIFIICYSTFNSLFLLLIQEDKKRENNFSKFDGKSVE